MLMLAVFTASAQTSSNGKKQSKANVTGFVKDSESGEAMVRATIQVMSQDTTQWLPEA